MLCGALFDVRACACGVVVVVVGMATLPPQDLVHTEYDFLLTEYM